MSSGVLLLEDRVAMPLGGCEIGEPDSVKEWSFHIMLDGHMNMRSSIFVRMLRQSLWR